MSNVLGKGWWINPTKEGNFVLMSGEIDSSVKFLEDATDDMLKKLDIEIFNDYESADSKRMELLKKEVQSLKLCN